MTVSKISTIIKTQKEKEFVIKQIRIIQENFPCHECKNHFWDYLNCLKLFQGNVLCIIYDFYIII